MTTVLSFDIGIRNLAWCLMKKKDDNNMEILGWENVSIANDDPISKNNKCTLCSVKPVYEVKNKYYCSKHSPLPPLCDLSGNKLKKIPDMNELKQILFNKKGIKSKSKSKSELLNEISELNALPYIKPKSKKAVDTTLTELHDNIRKFIEERKDLFKQATIILLENQPVLKNPTMKSVQILLFATLRDLLQPSPVLKLVHAGSKVKGKKTGDEGYSERKKGSEVKATEFLQKKTTPMLVNSEKWLEYLNKFSKKNDLTDAFCMCIDGLLAKSPQNS